MLREYYYIFVRNRCKITVTVWSTAELTRRRGKNILQKLHSTKWEKKCQARFQLKWHTNIHTHRIFYTDVPNTIATKATHKHNRISNERLVINDHFSMLCNAINIRYIYYFTLLCSYYSVLCVRHQFPNTHDFDRGRCDSAAAVHTLGTAKIKCKNLILNERLYWMTADSDSGIE